MRPTATQAQLILPLLEELDDAGGSLPAGAAIRGVADRTKASPEQRTRTVQYKTGAYRLFDRNVRWAKQRASLEGLIASPKRGQWQLTGKGQAALRTAKPGVVVTIFTTRNGIALWGKAEQALQYLDGGSVQMILTSPPYDLVREKDYGNLRGNEYLAWMTDLARGWSEALCDDGSLVINLGDAYNVGSPTLNLYQERLLLKLVDELGYHLCGRFEWHNPSTLPSPRQWVCNHRVRVTGALQRCYWLSLSEHPKADNRKVLRPYSERMKKLVHAGGESVEATRPSGHQVHKGGFAKDNGGSIPSNLIQAANTASNTRYHRKARESGLPIHPASFPEAVPEFFMKFLTDEGDLVYDPMAGRGTTAWVAERLNRRWITSEAVLDYVYGHQLAAA